MDELSPVNITETAVSGAYEKILAMVEGFGALLRKLAIALVLLVVFYPLGRRSLLPKFLSHLNALAVTPR